MQVLRPKRKLLPRQQQTPLSRRPTSRPPSQTKFPTPVQVVLASHCNEFLQPIAINFALILISAFGNFKMASVSKLLARYKLMMLKDSTRYICYEKCMRCLSLADLLLHFYIGFIGEELSDV